MVAVKDVGIDGRELKEALEAAKSYLERHIDEVNSLNVFPVPDGDTGINMFLTMRSAVQATEEVTDNSVTAVSAAAAKGALLGARGNSGVILSQILRGIAKGLEGRRRTNFRQFAEALHLASEQAYKVVAHPVEGTILTVIKEVSREASQVAEKGTSFSRATSRIVKQAGETVKRTPELLPVLKEAGVVDAGAKGLYYFFAGMRSAICGRQSRPRTKKTPSHTTMPAKEPERVYGFDVQFLLEGEDLPVEEITKIIAASGESPLVVGDVNLLKVHVHTMNPEQVLSYARSKGTLKDIVVEDMDLQVQGKRKTP
jgi:hypothetical protein